MKLLFATLFLSTLCCNSAPTSTMNNTSMDTLSNSAQEINSNVKISIALLEAIKNGSDASIALSQLAALDLDELAMSLNSKQKKLAFWVNIYNGFIQYELVSKPALFDDRDDFYKGQRHKIAGVDMSYDDIEHGILRNSRVKLSLGYFKHIFVSKWEKKLRNKDIDGRIHFALNCGAIDCPAVAIYNDLEVEAQLNKMATRYLKKHTSLVDGNVTTSPLFSWFRGDFGGKRGIAKFLIQFEIIPEGKYSLDFKSYDWTLDTGNYVAL